jgi:plastocyanin
VSPKVFRLLFVATVVAGMSAPMMAAHGASEQRSVDVYDPPKGFFVLGAPDPKVLEIYLNDTVTWNIMQGEHTVTPEDAKRWGDGGSETLGEEDSGTYIADNFKALGDYAYYCKLHGGMSGIIRVIDTTPSTQPPATQPPTTQPPTTQPPTTQPPTATTRPGQTPPATTATAPTTRPGPTAPAPTATTAKPDKDKKKDPKDETTTTIPALTPPPPPIDLPDEAIVPSLPGASAAPTNEPEAPLSTPEGEAVALLKSKKNNGGDAMKLLIVSGLGLGALGVGTAGYKYANRSSKYFPA